MSTMDIDLLRRLLRYDPATGQLTWLKRTPDLFTEGKKTAEQNCDSWNARFAGKPALYNTSTYDCLRGTIFNRTFLAHRVCWALHYGSWPTDQIDHINGNPFDNRIENLRNVSNRENNRNKGLTRGKERKNTSGRIGVYWVKKTRRWCAQIVVNGKQIGLGTFVDFDAACAARAAAEKEHGFHPNHGRDKHVKRRKRRGRNSEIV